MKDNLKLLRQYLAPHHFYSRIIYCITRTKIKWFKNWSVNKFIRMYGVDMSEAERESVSDYETFNEFFTRKLKEGARPDQTNDNEIMCPVDGSICEMGDVTGGRVIQAKQHDFSLHELLGERDDLTNTFANGHFSNIYLSPKDYHRYHMPIDGKLKEMIYIPGRLFSVSPFTAERIPNLFARNERAVLIFETAIGPMAMVCVGAMCVSAMSFVWHGLVTPRIDKELHTWTYNDGAVEFKKGEEVGQFNMGSTVILVFPKGTTNLIEMDSGEIVRLGQSLGSLSK